MMEKETIAVIQQMIWKLVSEWHDMLGVCGNYWEGGMLGPLLISIITYKRIDDKMCAELKLLAEEGWIDEEDIKLGLSQELQEEFMDSLTYMILPKHRWQAVKCAKKITQSFNDAILGINYLNYCNLPYGDTLIPRINIRRESLAGILLKWMDELSTIDLNSLSEREWQGLSSYIRKKYVKNPIC